MKNRTGQYQHDSHEPQAAPEWRKRIRLLFGPRQIQISIAFGVPGTRKMRDDFVELAGFRTDRVDWLGDIPISIRDRVPGR